VLIAIGPQSRQGAHTGVQDRDPLRRGFNAARGRCPHHLPTLREGRPAKTGPNLPRVGPPGVGKTHLAVALGLKACAGGYRTAFATATALVSTLTRAHQEGRLEETLNQLIQPKLLIIDEIGYLPLDRLGANLLFQLVSRRYERGSHGVTVGAAVQCRLPGSRPRMSNSPASRRHEAARSALLAGGSTADPTASAGRRPSGASPQSEAEPRGQLFTSLA
jgi:hypothetical protein